MMRTGNVSGLGLVANFRHRSSTFSTALTDLATRAPEALTLVLVRKTTNLKREQE